MPTLLFVVVPIGYNRVHRAGEHCKWADNPLRVRVYRGLLATLD